MDRYYVAVISSTEAGVRISAWEVNEEEINEPFNKANDAYICGNPLPQGQGLRYYFLQIILSFSCKLSFFDKNSVYFIILNFFSNKFVEPFIILHILGDTRKVLYSHEY